MACSGQDTLKNWEKDGLEGVEATVKTFLEGWIYVIILIIAEWNCPLVLVMKIIMILHKITKTVCMFWWVKNLWFIVPVNS